MGKTKRRRNKKQSRRKKRGAGNNFFDKLSNKRQSRRKKRGAGNNFFDKLSNLKTPEEQNSYLRKTVSDLTNNIDFELSSGYFTTYWKTIDTFLKKLAYYEMISYPGGHGPPTPTFIEEIYENRTKLLKNIEEIEDIHTKYRALRRHGLGTHHHGRPFNKILQPKRPYSVTKSFSNKRKLTDIAKAMEKNVLPLTDFIKKVIEMKEKKRED
jgi:hypothetical protein